EELHRDLLAIVKVRDVHLPERRGRERRALDVAKYLRGSLAEALAERGLEIGEGVRGDLILELLELLTVHARQEAAHDREHLPELDEDAAEPEHPPEEAPSVPAIDALPPLLEPRGEHPLLEHGDGVTLADAPPEEADQPELDQVAREDDPEDEQRSEQPDE